MKNFVENQCIKTDKPLPMSYEALKAERDALVQRVEMLSQNLGNAIWSEQEALQRVNALAVENAALKDVFGSGEAVVNFLSIALRHTKYDCIDLPDVALAFKMSLPETPATDAALAAIQAQGVEKFADFLDSPIDGQHCYQNEVGLARHFASTLREAK